MKKFFYFAAILFALAACDTPSQVIGKPDATTNTSGTTGSANMTNTTNTPPQLKDQPGAPKDTVLARKDSLPK